MAQSALSAALSALSSREFADKSLLTSRPRATSPGNSAVSSEAGESNSKTNSSGSAVVAMYTSIRRQSDSISPRMRPVSSSPLVSSSGPTRAPLACSFRGPIPSSSFPSSSNASVPVSPNMFPFSPPITGVRVLRDRRRRGSSVVTTTILSPYDGELMFSSSFDERELKMNEDAVDYDMDDMDVDEMDLDYKSDTDEEDWQSAGVESLRRGNAFHLMGKDGASSSSSDSAFSAFSRASVLSTGTTDTKLSVYSQSMPAVAIMKPAMMHNSQPSKSIGMHMDVNRQEREADAIQALVQLRSL
ncbi:uncharacterized protein V1513DRAFT_92648 [Lipomyces chichibuensis]|uniref:uncharacterized protein n=1 Tax=Lipomyces chichibuensis TaxID=1546026 RepID=UPI0033438815